MSRQDETVHFKPEGKAPFGQSTYYMGEYSIGGHFVSVVHQKTCFDAFSLNLIFTQQYQSNLSYSKKLFN